jgi:hypothetical protein
LDDAAQDGLAMSALEDRAVRAQQLLDDDLLKEILDRLEKDAVNTALGTSFEPQNCVSAVAYMQAAFEIQAAVKLCRQ